MLDYKTVKYFKLAVNSSDYNENENDIACRCPICGDSTKKRNSKRLHLYKKGDLELVNCFNAGCPCENKTMYSFLRDFYPSLLPQYRKETLKYNIDKMKSTSLKDLVIEPRKSDIVLYDLLSFFEPIDTPIYEYLKLRNIFPHIGGTWYKGKTNIKIGEITYNIKDYLIIPLYHQNKMYGFYSRDICKKHFITFVSTPGYKVWNWFNINKVKPVYIFEAIFDAISTDKTNIIANLGAKLPEDRLKELKNPIFCLDNDTTGIKEMIKYAERGYSVYVQPKEYIEKDFNELKNARPDLDISKLIDENIYTGISAITRLKSKL